MRKPDKQSDELSRRKYIQAMVAISAAGAAGCTGGDTTTDEQTDGPDTTVGLGVSGDNKTDTGTDTGTEQEAEPRPDGEPVATTLTSVVENVRDQANFSTWQTGDRAAGKNWMTEITGPRDQAQNKYLDGHTWDAPHLYETNEVDIPVVYTDYELEPPYDVTESMNEELTYWDGSTNIDAEGRLLHDYVYYGYDGLIFNEKESFNNEASDQFTYHWWYDTGERRRDELLNSNEPELNQEAKPKNTLAMETGAEAAVPNAYPHEHPGFTEPYADRFMDATSAKEVQSITDELNGDRISIQRFADNGWGSGLYKLESADDVGETSATLTLRDDHPNDHASIPEIKLNIATADRAQVLRSKGKVDIETGAIAEQRGTINRQVLPDHIQETERWLQRGADTLSFNFNNKHLGRLWFRRALLAAVDWNMVIDNGWGLDLSQPNPHHTGLLKTESEAFFSDEFLDSLYTYPMEADTALAAKWMKRGGYTRQGGKWVGPDGDTPNLDFVHRVLDAYTNASQTIKANLDSFGIPVSINVVNWDVYTQRLKPPDYDYDMMFIWSATNLINAYKSNGAWWEEPIISGNANDSPYFEAEAEDEVDGLGRPIEAPLPNEAGSIDAPEGAYKVPDLDNAETVNIIDAIDALREPGISEEEIIERAQVCARYANYYMPMMVFHQYFTGMYGNVRDFNFAPKGHPMYGVQKEFGTDKYATLAGMNELKYDKDYSKP